MSTGTVHLQHEYSAANTDKLRAESQMRAEVYFSATNFGIHRQAEPFGKFPFRSAGYHSTEKCRDLSEMHHACTHTGFLAVLKFCITATNEDG